MVVPNLWAVCLPWPVQFGLVYRTVGKVGIVSAVCISDNSTVTTECIQKLKEILFVFIIAKEQALNYCASFFLEL